MKFNRDFKIGLIICSSYLLWAITYLIWVLTIGEWPTQNIRIELLEPFSKEYILGTDIYGRSILGMLSAGVLYSLVFALVTAFSSTLIGIVAGGIMALASSRIAAVVEGICNTIYIFPTILVAILVMSFWEGTTFTLWITLVSVSWPGYARIARGEFIRLKNLSYVESAKAIGVSPAYLFYKTMLPGVLPVIIVQFVLGLSGVIMSESTLGFLGLGASQYTWGELLAMAKDVLLEAPHLAIFSSLTMAGIILGLNLLGDGLRDILDPKSSGS